MQVKLKLNRKLIFVELNEINFSIVAQYIQLFPGRYPSLQLLLGKHSIRTMAETNYEWLEPWIQWVSVHSGQSYQEHQIFRLGDIVGSKVPQLFEKAERMGARVGCVSPMNAENRLQRPAYFIPDPWTKTPSDESWWSRELSRAISQVVNDNSQSRVSTRSALMLFFSLLRFSKPSHYGRYIGLAMRSRGAPWRKALLLDLFLHDLHLKLFQRKNPDFSTIFLNAGAHIQHHYMLNAEPIKELSPLRNPSWYVENRKDPVAELLEIYDTVVGELLHLKGADLIIATGLSQKPYDRVKFYYRLRNHEQFLMQIGINFQSVHPLMTRDFLIEFDSSAAAEDAKVRLASLRVTESGLALFEEIDNRGKSLFVTLTYHCEISADTVLEFEDLRIHLLPQVVFVAIKNGMHQSMGYAFFTSGVKEYAPLEGSHVKDLHNSILKFIDKELLERRQSEALDVF